MPKEHKILKGFLFRLVKKRIAGNTLSSVLQQARENSIRGVHTTITFLNDSVDDATKARYNTNTYIQLAKQSSRLHLNTDISLRLSQMGMKLNNGIAETCLSDVINAAKETDTHLWIELESTMDIAELFEIYRRVRKDYNRVGIELPIWHQLEVDTIKKYLKKGDTVKLTAYSYPNIILSTNGNAQKKPSSKKVQKKHPDNPSSKYVLENYISNISRLMQADVKVAVLEPDEKLIKKLVSFSKEYKKSLIFELPLGYSQKWLNRLIKMKINLSIYTPYGKDWSSYVLNKLTVGHGRLRNIAARVLDEKGKIEIDEDAED